MGGDIIIVHVLYTKFFWYSIDFDRSFGKIRILTQNFDHEKQKRDSVYFSKTSTWFVPLFFPFRDVLNQSSNFWNFIWTTNTKKKYSLLEISGV
jgi:hypothetical protein